MIRTALILSATLTVTSVHAQTELQTFTDSGQRAETSFFVAEMLNGQFAGAAGAVFIAYGAPTWKDEYASQADQLKGKIFRLGKDNWATFDNTTPVAFGGVTVPVGLWYLAIARDTAGKWSVVFIDPAKAKAAGAWPFAPDKAPRAHEVPLTAAAAEDDVTETMTVTLDKAGKDPTKGKLTIAWGTYKVSSPFQLEIKATGPKDASADKDGDAKPAAGVKKSDK